MRLRVQRHILRHETFRLPNHLTREKKKCWRMIQKGAFQVGPRNRISDMSLNAVSKRHDSPLNAIAPMSLRRTCEKKSKKISLGRGILLDRSFDPALIGRLVLLE